MSRKVLNFSGDILATGHARLAVQSNQGAKVAFGKSKDMGSNDKEKLKLYWSEIFENNPNILQPGEDLENIILIPDYPSSRPFVNYKKSKYALSDNNEKNLVQIVFEEDYAAVQGDLYFTPDEIRTAEQVIADLDSHFVIVDPNSSIKNKEWPADRWKEFTENKSYNFVQLVLEEEEEEDSEDILPSTTKIKTKTIRDACAILKASVGKGVLVSIDSPLHHAAAAVGLPATVLWSHYSHPDILGYADHINIRWDAIGKPCGLRDSCIQCKKSMEIIKVDDVILAVEMALKKTP
jgi:ADP-heptose:LPS heptosyltransferase